MAKRKKKPSTATRRWAETMDVDQAREELVAELEDWRDGEDYPVGMWEPIFADVPVPMDVDPKDRRFIARQLVDQVQYASADQVRQYALFRSEYITRGGGS